MPYYRERLDGTPVLHSHKQRTILKNKIISLLATYSLDDVLSEVAAQRQTFDIYIRVASRREPEIGKPEIVKNERSA